MNDAGEFARPRQWGRGRVGWEMILRAECRWDYITTVLSQQNLVGPRWTVSLGFLIFENFGRANAGGTTISSAKQAGHQPVATKRACLRSHTMDATVLPMLVARSFEAAGMPAGLQVERPAQPGGPGSFLGSVPTE